MLHQTLYLGFALQFLIYFKGLVFFRTKKYKPLQH